MITKFIINTDGGARGNPGPAAAGVVIQDQDRNTLKRLSRYLGVTTNNQAEYQAVILALESLLPLPPQFSQASSAEFILDSELVVRQLSGIYKIKHPDLKPLALKIFGLVQQLPFPVRFTHVRRHDNSHADRLVNEELDRH